MYVWFVKVKILFIYRHVCEKGGEERMILTPLKLNGSCQSCHQIVQKPYLPSHFVSATITRVFYQC